MKATSAVFFAYSLLAASSALQAAQTNNNPSQKQTPTTEESQIEKILVKGVRQRLHQAGMLKDVIQKTEVISSAKIDKHNAVTLNEAIASSPGVRVNNECSMCGAKRVMLNGLRGEHTTVLVDGIPLYTMLSGFYGLDAAATAGLESIEIARGAGASLTAPEAIGGSLNMITKTAYEDALELDVSVGENGYKKASLVATAVANHDSSRFTLIGQFDDRDEFDGDNNGVSENPQLENQFLTLKLSQDLGARDNLELRASLISSEVFGGPTNTNIAAVRADYKANPQESKQLFANNDVRNRFIGHSWETAEWVKSDRRELSANWLHEFSSDLNMNLILADVVHKQDSFYEAFDYDTRNTMRYVDLHLNLYHFDNHHVILGINGRFEKNRSQTSLDKDPNYVSDSFDYNSRGLYVQDTWTVTDNLEIAAAVRLDTLTADFVDDKKPGIEIDENIVSPRVDIRYLHNQQWTSRWSIGRGYRAPLSFFESDHGLLDAGEGFDIQVDKLERSLSYNYALSYAAEKLNLTASITSTQIDNLALLGEATVNGKTLPSLQQADERVRSNVFDVSASYPVTEHLTLSTTFEKINYDKHFKQAFSIVPIEMRLNLSVDWDISGWDVFLSTTYIGERDLREYATESAASFDATGKIAKSRIAESFWTADVKITREISSELTLYIGANNIFDYSQAKDMQSPLMYVDGGYDVIDIYGSLRGREGYIGLKWAF